MTLNSFLRSASWVVLGALPLLGTAAPLALTGATLIDVAEFGTRTQDIADAVVLIEGERILAVGTAQQVIIPPGAEVIDVHGRFLVPGLIEGFGGSKTQGFANAWLYNGVTSVSTNRGDSRRGETYAANPGPRIFQTCVINGIDENKELQDGDSLARFRLEGKRQGNEALTAQINESIGHGCRTLLIHYLTWPDQVDWIVREAKRLKLGVLGEHGWTSYHYGARAGVSVFVHSPRYLSALAPADLLLAYADGPFKQTAVRAVADYLLSLAPDAPEVQRYGKFLASSGAALMPNLVMGDHWSGAPSINPWQAASARLVLPAEVHRPIDARTGISLPFSTLPPAERDQKLARGKTVIQQERALNAQLAKSGVHFIAASGGPAFGVLPGSGMVEEVIAMQNVLGLTPRQALATATSNYADTVGWNDVGRLEPGRYADVLALGSDPRLDAAALRDIQLLIANGKRIERPALLRLKRTPANSPASARESDQR